MIAWVLLALLAAAVGLAVVARARRRRAAREPDPFAVLSVQVRLGQLAGQLRRLDADPAVWARGRRTIAVQAAYDALLVEACRMAGIEVEESLDVTSRTDDERFREEVALTERGWSW